MAIPAIVVLEHLVILATRVTLEVLATRVTLEVLATRATQALEDLATLAILVRWVLEAVNQDIQDTQV